MSREKDIQFIKRQKKRSMYLVLGPSERKNFRLPGLTPRKPFKVLNRT